MTSGHLDPPFTLPARALTNLSFLYGGDRCHCDHCERCVRRKAFANGIVASAPTEGAVETRPATPIIATRKLIS